MHTSPLHGEQEGVHSPLLRCWEQSDATPFTCCASGENPEQASQVRTAAMPSCLPLPTSSLLSVGQEEHVEAVDRILKSSRQMSKVL